MDGTRLDQLKEGDLGLELCSIRALHVERASHRAERRGEWTARGVLKCLSGFESRLFADDARSMDLFAMPGSIDDCPVSIQQLDRHLALVGDPDRIKKEPAAGRWGAVLGRITCSNKNANARSFSFRRCFEEVCFTHVPDVSRRGRLDRSEQIR